MEQSSVYARQESEPRSSVHRRRKIKKSKGDSDSNISNEKHSHVIIDIPPESANDLEFKKRCKEFMSSEGEPIDMSRSNDFNQSGGTDANKDCSNFIDCIKVFFYNPCTNMPPASNSDIESGTQEISLVNDIAVQDNTHLSDTENSNDNNERLSHTYRVGLVWRIIRSIKGLKNRGRRSEIMEQTLIDTFVAESREEDSIDAINNVDGKADNEVKIITTSKSDISSDIESIIPLISDNANNEITIRANADVCDTTSLSNESEIESESELESEVEVEENIRVRESVCDNLDNAGSEAEVTDEVIDEYTGECTDEGTDKGTDEVTNEYTDEVKYSDIETESVSVDNDDSENANDSEDGEDGEDGEEDNENNVNPSDIEIIKDNLKAIASLEPGNKLYEDYYGRLSIDNSYVPGLMRALTRNSRTNTIPRVVQTINTAKVMGDPEILKLINEDVIKGLQNLINTYSDAPEVSSALADITNVERDANEDINQM